MSPALILRSELLPAICLPLSYGGLNESEP
jgi:hypothetical protein